MKRPADESCEHRTVWMGLCAKCGCSVGEEEYVRAGFVSLDSGFRVKKAKVLELQQETLSGLRKEKKGVLVFDLDHTLIHVTMPHSAAEAEAVEDMAKTRNINIKTVGEADSEINEEDIFKFSLVNTLFYLKLRPGTLGFLNWCSQRFSMYVYTHGTVPYAAVILKTIDPTGELFGERIIARESLERPAAAKQLSRIFPSEYQLCLIIDDRRDVWALDAHENLIQVSPYLFFKDKDRQAISLYGALLPPSSASAIAEVDEDRQLAALQEILDKVVSLVFADECDVRPHLVAMKRSVLQDQRVMTSGIVPTNEEDPWSHPVSVTLRELGSIEAFSLEEVDILIAASPHTEKARQVLKRGGAVVRPEFLLYAASTLCTPDIEKFSWTLVSQPETTRFSMWDTRAEIEETGDDLLNDLLG